MSDTIRIVYTGPDWLAEISEGAIHARRGCPISAPAKVAEWLLEDDDWKHVDSRTTVR